ncbi:MAG: hypothetical protein KatS3mg045_1379 [Bellilinea sp.]|nr:MAG: hypothetical protein KatS3mg045_1379 [Bellilinea sp.]
MTVSEMHRFLYGRIPQGSDRRIWVLSGQIHDWFFHDLFYGCVNLRRSLELWGLNHGLRLTVTLRRDCTLDFSGNPDADAAQQIFESVRWRRTPRYSQRPGQSESTPNPMVGGVSQKEEVEERARQVAVGVRQTADGAGQAILNTMTKLTHLLTSSKVPSLILVEDFPSLIESLMFHAHTAAVAREIIEIVRNDWHRNISNANLLVFLTIDEKAMKEIFPPETFRGVYWQRLEGPKPAEIQAALERLARRHDLLIREAPAIATSLARYGNLRVALGNVIRVVSAGQKEITLESVLQLPPIQEAEVAAVREELHALVGLQDVKAKFDKIERRARELRSMLQSGGARLPEETMHMIFLGAPGTGKTTVARIMARLFHALGLLSRAEVREITASSIMSSTVGETRENMYRTLEEARGGVLFIDEAHQFGDRQSFQAREAVDALVPAAWNLRHEMVIILAGYANQMADFFNMDEGLARRFPPHGRIEFADYSLEELWEILERKLTDQGYGLEDAARPRLRAVLRRRMQRKSFGNAGGVENLVNEIIENHRNGQSPQTRVITVNDLPPLVRRHPEYLNRARTELGKLVGMAAVRERIETILARTQYDLEEEEQGRGTGEVKLHPGNMLFVGPPGTGKTTVGQLIADLLYGIGSIDRPVCTSATRADLVGAYQGHSALKVRGLVERARDGVLFIDEAYGLVQDEHDTFGHEALTELLSQITNPENEGTVFILAGYETELRRLLAANPGLSRRFPIVIPFQNFTPADCVELACRILQTGAYVWEEGVLERVHQLSEEAIVEQGEFFGNAGWLKSLIEGALERMKRRVIEAGLPPEHPDRRRVKLEDLPSPRRGKSACGPGSVATTSRVADWIPHPDAIDLSNAQPESSGLSEEELGRKIVACAYQILVKDVDGEVGSGTGFFVTADGLMATSAHLVEKAMAIQVWRGRNQTPCEARVVLCNADLDLALLAVNIETPCPYLPLGRSLTLQPLTQLIVFGNAHVRPGEPGRLIMARVARNDGGDPLHIETDGAIEPGFSGGPAVDRSRGVVVGVVRGGYGPSATLLVRSEQLMELLLNLGYHFAP